jgi:MFS family permease
MVSRNKSALAKSAFRFVLIIGIVNLLADFTYEGGRAVVGPFLGSLGASAAVIGFVAGFGEFVGYALRSISGYFADKTHRYWPFAFAGYALNQLAIPALALVTNWQTGSALVIAERTGRAIRKPAMDAMLSHAGESIGAGWVFGLNEALDQAGATAGPLLIAYILSSHGSYRMGFGVFLLPAILCLLTVVIARLLYPRPHELETRKPETPSTKNLTQPFWMYLVAGALIAAGLADFSLMGFHFQKAGIVAPNVIPIFYAVAMATSALSALIFGRLVDRFGRKIAALAFFLSAGFAPFVFLGNATLAFVGMILWGIGMGAEGSVLRALVTGVIPSAKRGTAFGFFDAGFGIAWFLGSAAMGLLYEKSIFAVVVFSIAAQLAALPFFLLAKRQ